MTAPEVALRFMSGANRLIGILSPAAGQATRGVLMLVGGPQYRVGPERQLVLFARRWARDGIPVMRFDFSGMGDSEGERSAAALATDVAAAIDAFCVASPGLRQVVLWGLCDAASIAAWYAPRDPRVLGVVMVSPWIDARRAAVRAALKHHYWPRLRTGAFWAGLLRGRTACVKSLRAITAGAAAMVLGGHARGRPPGVVGTDTTGAGLELTPAALLASIERFVGPVLVILAGRDLSAATFREGMFASRVWQRAARTGRITCRELPDAGHTFARVEWRDRVAAWTSAWLHSW